MGCPPGRGSACATAPHLRHPPPIPSRLTTQAPAVLFAAARSEAKERARAAQSAVSDNKKAAHEESRAKALLSPSLMSLLHLGVRATVQSGVKE